MSKKFHVKHRPLKRRGTPKIDGGPVPNLIRDQGNCPHARMRYLISHVNRNKSKWLSPEWLRCASEKVHAQGAAEKKDKVNLLEK
jgi:hypothetical protein